MKNFSRLMFTALSFLFTVSVYAAAPVILSATENSSPTASYNGTSFYDNGETLSFAVKFDQAVDVAGGTPELKFRAPDNLSRKATYSSGSGTDTLIFDYSVGSDPNVNDWNGIELEDSSGNPANLVMNGATIQNTALENAVVTVPVTNFAGIKIDSKEPTFNEIQFFSFNSFENMSYGVVNGNTRYLKAGDKIKAKIILAEGDSLIDNSASTDIKIGATTKTLVFTSDNTDGRAIDATKQSGVNFLNGENGEISVEAETWKDQANKDAVWPGGIRGVITLVDDDVVVTRLVVDTITPTIAFGDDVEVGPVSSDDFDITVTDTNANSTTFVYGFSNDSTCDNSDVYNLTFANGTTITISDESHNGQYICAKAEDFAGNVGYQASANPLNIDVTAPVFASIGVVSNNPIDSNYGKADSILTFTLTLTNPDSYDGNGSIDFTINGTPYSANLVDPANLAAAGTFTATFDLSTAAPADNAVIVVTGVNFADSLAQPITNFSAGAPTPTVIVDTKAPTITSASAATNGNGGVWATNNQTATFTLGFDEDIIRGILNSASSATNISTLTKEFNISTFGTTDTIVFTAQNGDNGNVVISNADFTIIDRAGNTTTISTGDIAALIAGTIKTDTTKPTATNITISSNNVLDTTLAKTNDTITVSLDTADNLSATINLVNNSILNSSAVDGVSGATGAGKNIARFTDGTEISEVLVPFLITIEDEAGNKKTYTQSDLSGANIRFDRTNPIVQEVKISATSADNTAFLGDVPTYYAKQGDSLDFELQVCDYVDSQNNPPTGTIFGQAVTLTDAGPTGTACTTPEGNTSVWRKWTANFAGIDGVEGLVTFTINVNDNAGNILLNVAGTTDGSSVIFDKTIPLNPTDVVDAQGVAITPFKHHTKAQFSWTNDADDTSNSAVVSGIQNYNVRLTNPANGGEIHRDERISPRNFDGRLSTLAPWSGLHIPPRDISDPYNLHIQTRDKAGNDALEVVAYTQPYTIGFVGRVTDNNGNPISRTSVQIVSRFGETCNLNQEVCVGITDGNGEYTVLAQKDQDYNLTFFHQRYYLDKQEQSMGHDDDTIVNSILTGITSPHEVQTSNQIVEITTDKLFVREDGQNVATKIWVASFSGEITHTTDGNDVVVTSLSRIVLVKSNNPNVQIVNEGNNTWRIVGAGNVLATNSVDNSEAGNSSVSAFGIPANYSSGSSRIGTKYIPSNGNPHNTFGKYKTPAEWKSFGDRLRYGVKPEVLTYINRNGFEVFRGYRYGILGWDRPTMKRFQNPVKFRGNFRRGEFEISNEDGETVISMAEKVKVMKSAFQKEFQAPEYKSDDFKEALEVLKPLKRISPKDAYKGILTRNAQKKKVNIWAHRRSGKKIISRDQYARNLKVIRLQLGNGHSIKIERVIK